MSLISKTQIDNSMHNNTLRIIMICSASITFLYRLLDNS